MDEKTAYWTSVILGAAALVLLIVNMSIINSNQHLADDIAQRRAAIDGSVTLDQIDRGIAQALADIATKDNDADARALLAAQGFTLTPPTVKAEEPAKDAKESKEPKKEPKKKSEESEE